MYQHDIFYDSDVLSFKDKRKLLLEAFKKNDSVQIDYIPKYCLAREVAHHLSFADFVYEWTESNIRTFKVIFRRGYYDPYIGLVGCINRNEEFLWIYVQEKQFNKLINKYKLKEYV